MPKFHLSVRARTLVPALLFSVAFCLHPGSKHFFAIGAMRTPRN